MFHVEHFTSYLDHLCANSALSGTEKKLEADPSADLGIECVCEYTGMQESYGHDQFF